MSFLKEHGSEIARTVVLSLLGAIGIILTPVRDQLQDWFRPERANVAIQSPDSVVVGHALDVSFIMIPTTTAGVSGGMLSFELKPFDSLQLLPSGATGISSTQLPVTELKSVTTIPSTPLRFKALRPGEVTLTATFLNRKQQKIETAKVITVEPITKRLGPSDLDYTGTWDIDLHYRGKAYHGEMCMEDKSELLSGSYSLNNGERGNISGKHDGKSFWVLLRPPGTATGWYLEGGGATPTEDHFLRITGKPSLCSKEPCPSSSGPEESFTISSSLLAPSPVCSQHP